MQVRDFFWGGSGWFLLPHSLAVIIETMSCWPTGVWHSLLFLSGSPHAARWPDCIRRILPCFWSERRAFGEQECAGSFPASSPSHVEERPSRASTWTCGRCCSCASSSAWAPGTKVSADKGPHSPTVRLDPLWWIQDDEIIGQLYLFSFFFFLFWSGGKVEDSSRILDERSFAEFSAHDAFEVSSPHRWFLVNRECVYVEGVGSGGSAVCMRGTSLCTELGLCNPDFFIYFSCKTYLPTLSIKLLERTVTSC